MPGPGSESAGEDFPHEVNKRAPVVGAQEIAVDAASEAVWAVLTAFESWPTWNPGVKSMTMQGDLAPGSVFRWKAGPGTITSTITRVERPRLIAWTGRTFGIHVIHVWHLDSQDGATIVRTQESFEGFMATLIPGTLQKTLDRSLADFLRYLKAEAERQRTGEA